jgi:hypothetical protein
MTINGERHRISKSLGIRYKEKALEALKKLQEMAERSEIDPFSNDFDPQKYFKTKTFGTINSY